MTETDAFTVAIIEDDSALAGFLADNLLADGYAPAVAETAAEGWRLLQRSYPDVALIDVELPDYSGLDLIRQVREADGVGTRVDPGTPLLVLSGRDSELDRLRGFDRGCDDYLTKPFAYAELRARLTALLRRNDGRRKRGRMRVGELELDSCSREVSFAGQPLKLSQKEFALLKTLAGEPTRVFEKAELLRTVWGYECANATRTLDAHACRLRKKLEVLGGSYVVNVWGVGYRLLEGPAQ